LNRIATVIANQRPDVVSLNEVMYNSSYGNGENQPATYKALLQQKTGQTWYSVYARMDGDWSSTSWAVGNLLLSRFPFSSTSRYALSYNRSVARGTIIVNGRTVNVFSTHVDYANGSYRTTQTNQLRSWASSWAESRIIMGDFNTRPGTSDYNIMANYYYDAWAEAVRKGAYSSSSGTAGYTHGGSRFDYIYESKGASALSLIKTWVVNSSGASDHDPVVATFAVQ
jgi:endonuclease/exonuclease/phosphatase family metal-dependent hydrolase